ncbi:MAG TPA: CGGC domain-containing protein [Desulfobacterales bacterium]|nr:CGGC domain-containing protein [Desulfobacterales bacterium]
MEKVFVIACGSYMDNGYGCPGEWRCLKAAALGEGTFSEPAQVIGFLRCECPGRPMISNINMAMKLSEIKPDKIYFSTCLANAKPECPYKVPEELAGLIEEKLGIEVVQGTHDYH